MHMVVDVLASVLAKIIVFTAKDPKHYSELLQTVHVLVAKKGSELVANYLIDGSRPPGFPKRQA